jgi:hypothetical protein
MDNKNAAFERDVTQGLSEPEPELERINISEVEARMLIDAAISGEHNFPYMLVESNWDKRFGGRHAVLQATEKEGDDYFKKQIDLLGANFIGKALGRSKSVGMVQQKIRAYPAHNTLG